MVKRKGIYFQTHWSLKSAKEACARKSHSQNNKSRNHKKCCVRKSQILKSADLRFAGLISADRPPLPNAQYTGSCAKLSDVFYFNLKNLQTYKLVLCSFKYLIETSGWSQFYFCRSGKFCHRVTSGLCQYFRQIFTANITVVSSKQQLVCDEISIGKVQLQYKRCAFYFSKL